MPRKTVGFGSGDLESRSARATGEPGARREASAAEPACVAGGFDPARTAIVDYRMARRHLINEYRRGRLARHQVCDAHPELVRNARAVGRVTERGCPICEEHPLIHVTYVFGSHLPSHGRCISRPGELSQLNKRSDALMAYVVEVCVECHWNHLSQVFPLGTPSRRRSSGAAPSRSD